MATRKTTKRPATKKPAAKARVARKAASVRTVAKKAVAKKPAPSPAMDMMRLAGVGNDAVMKATGKAWEEWLKLLDRAGAIKMPHKAIAGMVYDKFGVPGWWAQMVTVGYEQARGLRAIHEKSDGFSASASRTIAANLDRLYGAWNDPKIREIWLPAAPLEVRRSTDGKSMRIAWTLGNSSVDVNFYSKGPGKSMVQIQHSKLSDAEAVAAQKAYWSEGLERLRARLESGK
jgi:hypothetical protein